MAETEITNIVDSQAQDFMRLISSSQTKFLLCSNGRQVNIDTLIGKKLGLYFSASWCEQSQQFTPCLMNFYNEISTMRAFEIVYVSGDQNEESFSGYFSKMPWLAIPFSDSHTRNTLIAAFEVTATPLFVLINENGIVLNSEGVEIVGEYGVEGYPFCSERIKELKEIKERARDKQPVNSLLVSDSCNFVISSDGNKVAVSALVGKNILLYFSASWCLPCGDAFLPKLIEAYHEIKSKDENFEVIFISGDQDRSSFDDFFSTMPWLAIPFDDTRKSLLVRTFKVSRIPMVIALGPSGETVTLEAQDLIQNYGAKAYPFTKDRIKEIEAEPADILKKVRSAMRRFCYKS